MNSHSVDVVEATEAFLTANQRYVTLIRKAINHGGGQKRRLTARDLRNIAQAKSEKEELEAVMFAVWSRYGLQ